MEVGQAARDGVFGIDDFDGERAVRIVTAQVRVPGAPGEHAEFVPALERAAGEVDEDEALPALDEPLQARSFRRDLCEILAASFLARHATVLQQLERCSPPKMADRP